jgi:hypothetical protein
VALQEEIIKHVGIIASILKRGNHVEIKRNTDGTVKVFEVQKKIAKRG